MSRIPECSIEFVHELRKAEDAYSFALNVALTTADAEMHARIIDMDDKINALTTARRRLFVLLLQSGVKCKAAQRIAFAND